MKKRRRSAPLTGNKQGESGSIALEAALVLPVVLMVVIFFICMIRLNTVQMALHGAVSQTVKQAAANIHPIDLALQKRHSDDKADEGEEETATDQAQSKPVREPLPAVEFVADKLENWLPSPAGPLLSAVLKGDWKPAQDAASTIIGRSIVEPMLRHEADIAVLDPERLHLSKLSLPDLKDGSDPFLSIEAEYAFKLGFPFTKGTIVLKERAAERVWTADKLPAQGSGESADPDHEPIQIVLIEPVPVRPGNKARVVVKTSPGRSLSIKVLYKSGQSVAKNLQDAVTDANGFAEWTWHVSGNTTPGVWELVVTASDGTTAARHFDIRKKTEGTE
ncbi:hypothetical protein [Paenibacillus sp. R14(2021)]|uniref:hypothetical protein n=1 Tax=Paenibacillus sp. R14(2021) TaxID=2859228 RepID=UPI001C6132BD|nr:hypothetical protein [Paenibacillus sp. R14(2021)]